MDLSRPRALVVSVLALLASGLAVTTTATPAVADGPGTGTPLGRHPRRLLHLRRGRPLGRQLQRVVRRTPTRSARRRTSTTPPTPASRSTAATAASPREAHIGGGVSGVNLACSGSRTTTFTDSNGYFKPGLDFYNSGGQQGQALMLQNFATSHNVKLVSVSIGGNDFNFASIVQTCVTDCLTSPSWAKNYCNDDSLGHRQLHAPDVAAERAAIATALQNVRTAMRNAGYADNAWTLLVQNYPSPLPSGVGLPLLRVRLHPAEHRRLRLLEPRRRLGQRHARCPPSTAPSSAAPPTPGSTNVRTLDLSVGLQRPAALREHGRPLRGEGPDLVDAGRRGRPDRVDQPDPHRLHVLRLEQPVLHPGVAAPELLGAAGHPLVRAAGLERRQRRAAARAPSPAPGSSTASPGCRWADTRSTGRHRLR